MNKGDAVNEGGKSCGYQESGCGCRRSSARGHHESTQEETVCNDCLVRTFKVGKRKARKGRNPQTGAEIKSRRRNVPKFCRQRVKGRREVDLCMSIKDPCSFSIEGFFWGDQDMTQKDVYERLAEHLSRLGMVTRSG